jgi:hypothetical protein
MSLFGIPVWNLRWMGIYTASTYNTQIAYCTFGLNKMGGLCGNIHTRAGDQTIPVSVEHNTIWFLSYP